MINYQFKVTNRSNVVNEWDVLDAKVDCSLLKPIAIYCMILFVVSIKANSILIWVLTRRRSLVNNVNILIMALSMLSIINNGFVNVEHHWNFN
jgi:hypothetical protein